METAIKIMSCTHKWLADKKGWECDICKGRVDLPLYEKASYPANDNPFFVVEEWGDKEVNSVLSSLYENYEANHKTDKVINDLLSVGYEKYSDIYMDR